jgi:PHD/YefM family antitoxin component YafN of YafNO toxin-antitoxin module
MIKVSAAEFRRNLTKYEDLALTEPVAVTLDGRDQLVLVSGEEYHRLRQRSRHVLTLADFTDDDLADLERSRAPESSKAFDDEVKPR